MIVFLVTITMLSGTTSIADLSLTGRGRDFMDIKYYHEHAHRVLPKQYRGGYVLVDSSG